MGSPGPRQRQRTGAQLGSEQPVQVAGRVADAGSESVDPVALDHTVVDEPHGPPGGVGGDVPLW